MEYTVGTYVVIAVVALGVAYAIWKHGHKTGKDDAHDTIGTVAEAVVDHINDFVVDRQDDALFKNTVIPASQSAGMPVTQPVAEVNHYVKQGAIGTLNAAIETANAVKSDADEHLKEAAKTAVALAVAHAKDVTGDTDKGKDD